MALLACKLGFEEGSHNLPGQFDPNDSRPQAEHINRIMFNALMGTVGIMAKARTNPFDLIGHHTGPHTAATQHDGTVNRTFLDGFGSLESKIRVIIQRLILMCSQIGHLTPQRLGYFDQLSFQWETAMIGGKGNS